MAVARCIMRRARSSRQHCLKGEGYQPVSSHEIAMGDLVGDFVDLAGSGFLDTMAGAFGKPRGQCAQLPGS